MNMTVAKPSVCMYGLHRWLDRQTLKVLLWLTGAFRDHLLPFALLKGFAIFFPERQKHLFGFSPPPSCTGSLLGQSHTYTAGNVCLSFTSTPPSYSWILYMRSCISPDKMPEKVNNSWLKMWAFLTMGTGSVVVTAPDILYLLFVGEQTEFFACDFHQTCTAHPWILLLNLGKDFLVIPGIYGHGSLRVLWMELIFRKCEYSVEGKYKQQRNTHLTLCTWPAVCNPCGQGDTAQSHGMFQCYNSQLLFCSTHTWLAV